MYVVYTAPSERNAYYSNVYFKKVKKLPIWFLSTIDLPNAIIEDESFLYTTMNFFICSWKWVTISKLLDETKTVAESN